MFDRKRFISLVVVCLFVIAALVLNLPISVSNAFTQTPQPAKRPAGKSQKDREALAKKPAPSGTLKDRLDADDGYGAAIFFSSSVHGNLEVCGCPIHPLGGVARRASYLDAFRQRTPDVGTIQVDVGYIFSDETNSEGTDLRGDARLMNDWLARANEVLGLEVVNLSYRDVRYARSLLSPDAKVKPEKSTLISANIRSVDQTQPSPAPYVIKVLTGKRLPKPVRIAFIGLSDAAPDEKKAAVDASGFVINDPLAAAKAALAEVRDQVDVTAVVGYISMPTVSKLARQNDDLDLIIVADERGLVLEPRQLNNALVVYGSKETKHLGELRIYTDPEGVVDRFTARYVELDEVIPDHPELGKMTKQARQELDLLQKQLAEDEAKAYVAKAAGAAQTSGYLLSEACGKCHLAEYEVWQKSRHSHAFAILETKQRSFDSACIGCHSLGFQKQGFVNIKATPQFANVQCESCHGPGAEHALMPTAGNYKTPPKSETCLVCHDRENSPDFDFAKYWPVIAHTNTFKQPQPVKAGGKARPGGRKRTSTQ
ncbi:MAG TPA: multiheme c-type cytochrome [Blastocatellia bacterium]|nr:multiheme c-type cytochrome [Blastocatellia bacterium]